MLHLLKPDRGSTHSHRRVGRGCGSGRGSFCGKGCKGQKARAGRMKSQPFEGGQTPLVRRQPKRGGFTNVNRVSYEAINLRDLQEKLQPGEYSVPQLVDAGLVSGTKPVKLLGDGKLTKKFILTMDHASAAAKEAVEKAGGSVTILK